MQISAKTYLRQIQRFETIIEQRRDELKTLKSMLTSVKATDYSSDRVQTSKSPEASYVRLIHRIADLEREIDERIGSYVKRRSEIIGQIQAMDNKIYIEILYKRYVENKGLHIIRREIHYSYLYTKHLHTAALQAFEEKYRNLTLFNTF